MQAGGAQPGPGRGVERDDHFGVHRLGGRPLDAVGPAQEREVVGQPVLIEHADGFAGRQQ